MTNKDSKDDKLPNSNSSLKDSKFKIKIAELLPKNNINFKLALNKELKSPRSKSSGRFVKNRAEKCYKVPSISKCLKFKVLPKNS